MSQKCQRRMSLTAPVEENVCLMAGDNMGAVICCYELVRRNAAIDPDDIGGCYGALIKLDRMAIYGVRVGMLWGDVCRSDAGIVIAVLRAEQLGLAGVTAEKIEHAIDHRGEGLDIDAIVAAVQQRLPRFNLNAAYPSQPKRPPHKWRLAKFFRRLFCSATT